jgi:hypothetical protein
MRENNRDHADVKDDGLTALLWGQSKSASTCHLSLIISSICFSSSAYWPAQSLKLPHKHERGLTASWQGERELTIYLWGILTNTSSTNFIYK